MRRAGLFIAVAFAVFVIPYLSTQKQASARSTTGGEEKIVEAFVRALPEAYRTHDSRALLQFVREPAALAPLDSDLQFVSGRDIELKLMALATTVEDGGARVRTQEKWRVRDGAEREHECSAVFALEDGRIVGWEIFP